MSGIGRALGRGLSAAGYAVAETAQKAGLFEIQSELELMRMQRIEEFKLRRAEIVAERERQKSVERVDAKTGELADEKLSEKRALFSAGLDPASKQAAADDYNSRVPASERTAPADWTPEMQASVDQALGLERKQLMRDPKLRLQAGSMTGDVKLEKSVELELHERRLDATEAATAQRERAAERRDATQRYIADLRHDDSQKRLEALIRSQGSGKDRDGTRDALGFIDGLRKDLTAEASNLRALYKADLDSKRTSEDRAKVEAVYAPRFADLEQRRRSLEADFDSLRERVGLPARSTPVAPPKNPASPSASALEQKPEIAKVRGAPAGSKIGAKTDRGWEVSDDKGNLIGYVRR